MQNSKTYVAYLLLLGATSAPAVDQHPPQVRLVQSSLTEKGSAPFDLQAVITEKSNPDERADIEIFWAAPNKWKRTIKSPEFSQTLIVNGDALLEEDSGDYFPLGLRVLSTAMVDPKEVIDAVRIGDQIRTKADGTADESGKVCTSSPVATHCVRNPYGLIESIRAAGYSVDFTDYQKFKGKRVARLLTYRIDAGDSLQARITSLSEFVKYDEADFSISEPTPLTKQVRSVVVPESELRKTALQPGEIIWPQVLEDQRTRGETSYYLSIDRSGQVHEVLPVSITVERADDSARKQMMKWKFKPFLKDGVPVQTESLFNFEFDTRAYGPAAPLANEDARKLASNIVEPVLPPGKFPSGTSKNFRVSVDMDGEVIEMIADQGPPELGLPCMQAIRKWHFSPIVENGQPRPYRANIVCVAP